MLRRLAALVACVLLLAVAATGSVYVTTLPTGADVWIDGIYVGRTPLVLDALSTGHHTLGIAKGGWNPRQLDVTVEGGQTTLSSTRLDRGNQPAPRPTGSIAVRGVDLRGLRVDGVPVAASKDGTFPAPAGIHDVTVESPKGRFARQITVWPQTRTDVVIQPEDQQSRPSIVAPVEDYLPKSAVRVDGERIVIHYGGHDVVARAGETSYRVDGRSVDYDAAPTFIGTRLYLPIALLTMLAPDRNR